jgi:uncharacterized Tic20 family protein
MNIFKFEVIGMLLMPVLIFLGIVIAIVFYSKIALLPFWMITIIIIGFIASCAVLFFTILAIIKKINAREKDK